MCNDHTCTLLKLAGLVSVGTDFLHMVLITIFHAPERNCVCPFKAAEFSNGCSHLFIYFSHATISMLLSHVA